MLPIDLLSRRVSVLGGRRNKSKRAASQRGSQKGSGSLDERLGRMPCSNALVERAGRIAGRFSRYGSLLEISVRTPLPHLANTRKQYANKADILFSAPIRSYSILFDAIHPFSPLYSLSFACAPGNTIASARLALLAKRACEIVR